MAQVRFISSSLEETKKIALDFSKKIKKNMVIAFFGNLGAGKTTFIRTLINFFSKKEIEVTSPTFVYLNIYNLDFNFYHFDLYRIKNEKIFIEMGFDEYFLNDGVTLIEWSENIISILPENSVFITMNHLDENAREILIDDKRKDLVN